MTTLREAAQQALEALCSCGPQQRDAINALRAALKQSEQEPVAVVRWSDIGHISWRTNMVLPDDTPLYTVPPQRQREPVQEPVAHCTLEQLVYLQRMVPSSNTIPLYTQPQTKAEPLTEQEQEPCTPPRREWVGLMRGVRVEGDTVVISVKGGNDNARLLCLELLRKKEQ